MAMKKGFSILILLAVVVSVSAQSKTPYERKKEELAIRVYKKLGVRQEQINSAKDLGDIERLAIFFNLLEKLKTIEGQAILEEYVVDLKKAEKLKNSIDLYREKERKVIEERRNDSLNKVQLEKKRLEMIKNSDSSFLYTQIRSKLYDWYKKGEFEKSSEFLVRIEQNSKEKYFDICYEEVMSRIQIRKNNLINFELEKYQSETEMFGVLLEIDSLKWRDSISVPIKEAKDFRDNFSSLNSVVDDYSWCFYKKNLWPLSFSLTNEYNGISYEFSVPIVNPKNIVFLSSEFELEDISFDSSFVFVFSDIARHKIEVVKRLNRQEYEINASIGKVKVVRGDRIIQSFHPFNYDLKKATVYANILVSSEGTGKFVSIAKGSSSSEEFYKEAIVNYLSNIRFNNADHESTITIQFNF